MFTCIAPLFNAKETQSEQEAEQVLIAIEMSKSLWSAILAAMSFLSGASLDDELFGIVIKSIQNFSVIVGLVGLIAQRDAFLGTLCKSCVPGHYIDLYASHTKLNKDTTPLVLHDRNVVSLRALLFVAGNLTFVLEEKAWYNILEIFQTADGLVSMGKLGKKDADALKPKIANNSSPTSENLYTSIVASIKRFFDTSSKTMDDKSFLEFVTALCRLAKDSTIVQPASKDSMKIAEEKSFAVARIHDLSLVNLNRIVSNKPSSSVSGPSTFQIWDVIVNCLIDIAHHPMSSLSIRVQSCFGLSEILNGAIQIVDLIDVEVEKRILNPLKLLVVADEIPSPWFIDVQKLGLEILNRLLQTSGQNIKNGWSLVFLIMRCVIGGGSEPLVQRHNSTARFVDVEGDNVAVITSKTTALVRVAFPSLQLICTDFLSLLNITMLKECIETLGYFGSRQEDLNISLSSVGLMWSVSDFVLTRRLHSPSASILTDIVNGDASDFEMTKKTMDELWMFLLSNFSDLCSDPRPEVRNTANQTLFKTIGMNGQRLSMDSWSECIWSVIFPLLERVKTSSDALESAEKSEINSSSGRSSPATPGKTPNLVIHHSRNTASKQWDETKVLTLSGVTKCYIDFLPILVDLKNFQDAWKLFLECIRDWFLSGSPEVSMSAIKSFKSLVRYNITDSVIAENVQPLLIPYWTIAWNIWESIGLGVVSQKEELPDNSADYIIYGTLSQESLTVFISVLPDIFIVISSTFGYAELRRLFNIITRIPLYNTIPYPGAVPRSRFDIIYDIETVSPLQSAIIDLVSPGYVKSEKELDLKSLDLFHISHAPEIILSAAAGFSKYPITKRVSPSSLASQPADKTDFTYIALSKRSLQCLVSLFETHGKCLDIYSSGVFLYILNCLGTIMGEKYDCPAVGQKDSTPLWKFAATSFMTIVKIGLESLDSMITRFLFLILDLDPTALDLIYSTIGNIFSSLLLPKSPIPESLSVEEYSADEAFDISVLSTIEIEVSFFNHS